MVSQSIALDYDMMSIMGDMLALGSAIFMAIVYMTL